jgi:hypothetical protein
MLEGAVVVEPASVFDVPGVVLDWYPEAVFAVLAVVFDGYADAVLDVPLFVLAVLPYVLGDEVVAVFDDPVAAFDVP